MHGDAPKYLSDLVCPYKHARALHNGYTDTCESWRKLIFVVTAAALWIASVTQASLGGTTFKPFTPVWENNGSAFSTRRAALPQIRVDTLIGSQANNETKIKITIYFYKIIIANENIQH